MAGTTTRPQNSNMPTPVTKKGDPDDNGTRSFGKGKPKSSAGNGQRMGGNCASNSQHGRWK